MDKDTMTVKEWRQEWRDNPRQYVGFPIASTRMFHALLDYIDVLETALQSARNVALEITTNDCLIYSKREYIAELARLALDKGDVQIG